MKIVISGLGLYGKFHLRYFLSQCIDSHKYQLAGAADPFPPDPETSACLKEHHIPVFTDFETCLDQVKPDLAILASPIDCHKPQILACFARGVHVMCEKPLAATLEDIREIREARDASGLKLAVGFQWSFCDTIRKLKDDITAGAFGKPVHLKTFVSWQRATPYYSTWKGRINNADGFPIHDSILTNATAHYLHNMFFILDDEPASYQILTARANPIETFDTVFMCGCFKKGGNFTYTVSHCAEINTNPRFVYEFENGTVYFDSEKEDMVWAEMKDGTIKKYGAVSTPEALGQKNLLVAQAVEQDKPIRCSVEQVLPFATICEEVFAHPENFQSFDPEKIVFKDNMYQMTGLYEILLRCYQEGRMPTPAEKAVLGLV